MTDEQNSTTPPHRIDAMNHSQSTRHQHSSQAEHTFFFLLIYFIIYAPVGNGLSRYPTVVARSQQERKVFFRRVDLLSSRVSPARMVRLATFGLSPPPCC